VQPTTTLLLGVGNTIMGDDAVGIHVLRTLKKKLGTRTDLEFKELGIGGLRLVEELLGYEHVIIIDSIESKDQKIGEIREFTPDQFKETEQAVAPHITNFATALELYRTLEPSKIPKTIRILTIDIEPKLTFSEEISEPIRKAATTLVERITQELERRPTQPN
jgi:hydrogenase maturation protease